jgi:hypothetical protein
MMTIVIIDAKLTTSSKRDIWLEEGKGKRGEEREGKKERGRKRGRERRGRN